MTASYMVKRLIARINDQRLSDEGRTKIENHLEWLDEIAKMMQDHSYKDALRGVIDDRNMLLDAVDGHRLVNREGEELVGVEESVRFNVTTCLVNVLEQLAGPAPDDFSLDEFLGCHT